MSSRGRGAFARAPSTGVAPPPPRRTRGGSTRSTASPRERDNSLEADETHRDKRPKNQDAKGSATQAAVSTLGTTSPSTQVIHEAWTPQLIRGDHPGKNVGDSASSSETALALTQGLLLPIDMQKKTSSPLIGLCPLD
ncbi:hypothetical protein RHMOL_Rhmol05G0150100 [Rhododendron molle]|uniref:Uncharacterized protein n=1 Tax=Rhododendron molle TaxID=49168 RepID=A0ACC0NP38_RHOML|nr:hypothetical protein RHMOL_Rhmol05G0150100 [Rhododendron molle]